MSPNVIQVHHPLIEHSLTILRNKQTQTAQFRQHASVVSQIVLLEATKSLSVEPVHIETPLQETNGSALTDAIVLVPVLRAGLAMLFASQELLPQARVGFVGLERDEETAIARSYYQKLPTIFSHSELFILDPMLATGGSFEDTIVEVKKKGGKKIRLVCILAAPEGIHRITTNHPDVTIFTGAIDEQLNEKKYIVPGLGDFGDRYFGTVS